MVALAVLAFAMAAAPAPPNGASAPAANEVAAVEETLRIQSLLHTEARRARIWRWSWTGIYGALTAGQTVPVAFIGDRGTRADLLAGAATSAVGLIGAMALPPESIASSEALDRELAAPGKDPLARLACARALLRNAADDEAFARGPIMHAANAAVNVAAGLVLGFGYKRWTSAAITAVSGIAVGEVQIFTAPKSLLDRSVREAGAPSAPSAAATPPVRATVAPWVGSGGAGLRLVAQF